MLLSSVLSTETQVWFDLARIRTSVRFLKNETAGGKTACLLALEPSATEQEGYVLVSMWTLLEELQFEQNLITESSYTGVSAGFKRNVFKYVRLDICYLQRNANILTRLKKTHVILAQS